MEKLNFLLISSLGNRSISVSYHSRIDPVLIPYCSRIVLLSSSYHSRFRKRKQYGNDTEMIPGGREDEARMIGDESVSGYVEAREKRKSTSGPPRWETDWRIVEVEVLE